MWRILVRRALRELRANWLRHTALLLLTACSMLVVVGIVATAVGATQSIEGSARSHHVEDGEFTTLVPLTDVELAAVRERGITIEEAPSLDFSQDDGSTLRVMANRSQVDTIVVGEGRAAAAFGEVLLERLYAASRGISVGDVVEVGGQELTVVGIGTSPDYDLCTASMADLVADPTVFGCAFVTDGQYASLRDAGRAQSAEEPRYLFRLPSDVSAESLRDQVRAFKAAPGQAGDPAFTAYMDERLADRHRLEDAVRQLVDAADGLDGGVRQMGDSSPALAQVLSSLIEGASRLDDVAHSLQDTVGEQLDEHFPLEVDNVTSFVEAADNPRIGASVDDVSINVYAGLLAGVIVLVLIAYVISVFTVHGVDRAAPTIGALVALGVGRRRIMVSYALVPTLVCLVGGVLGTAASFLPQWQELMMGPTLTYYSTPPITVEPTVPLLLYGIAMPAVLAFAMNLLVIGRRLARPALSLLRGEPTQTRATRVRLRGQGFTRTFRTRQLLREWRSVAAVLVGMFVSLLLLFLGLDAYTLSTNVSRTSVEDTRYEYLYQYRYPTTNAPADGWEADLASLSRPSLGYDLSVTLVGLTEGDPFFGSFEAKGTDEVAVSSAVATRYRVRVGDELVLYDRADDKAYAFTVSDVVPYSAGLFCFMHIDDMRELLGEEDGQYNAVFADHALDIDPDRLLATTSRDDVAKSSGVFVGTMAPLIDVLVGSSALIFVIVLYQMTKVMVDRSAQGIALMRLFGYRDREIRRLYLDGSLVVVALGALALIPAAKLLMDACYPYLTANVAVELDVAWPWWFYPVAYAGVMACYLMVRTALLRRVGRIRAVDVLQRRE